MEGFAAVAVLGLLLRQQFREGLLNRRKVEERVIAKSIRSPRDVQQQAVRLAVKYSQRMTVPGGGDHAHEASRAFFGRDFSQLSNQARVVSLVVGVVPHQVRLVGGVTRGMHSRSAGQRIYFQPGIVGQDDFSRSIQTISLDLLAGIGLEGKAVFDHRRKGSEVRKRLDLDPQRGGGSGKVAELARVRCSDQNAGHSVTQPQETGASGKSATRLLKSAPPSSRMPAPREISPPMVLSGVRTNLIRTKFSPASSGMIICPVTSWVWASTGRPFTSTFHAG